MKKMSKLILLSLFTILGLLSFTSLFSVEAVTYHLYPGMNYIGTPFVNADGSNPYGMASELAESIGNIHQVDYWDGPTQTLVAAVDYGPFWNNDFQLLPGRAYMLSYDGTSETDYTFPTSNLSNYDYAPSFIHLYVNGLAWVLYSNSLPYTNTAEFAAALGEGVTMIMEWDPSIQNWLTYQTSTPSSSYDMHPFHCYYINSDTEANDDATSPSISAKLNPSYPNPFKTQTTIPYTLKNTGNVKMSVYNIKGQLVSNLLNSNQKSGDYKMTWDGTDNQHKAVKPGTYLIRLETGSQASTQKVILMK
jgi:hypothetical protein